MIVVHCALVCMCLSVHTPVNIQIRVSVPMYPVQCEGHETKSVTHDIFSSLPRAMLKMRKQEKV